MSLVLGIPPAIVQLVQEGLLERAFHDGLFPALQYRAEALAEEWPANTGTSIFMSRPGLLAPIVTPLVPGFDPVPQALAFEQWEARLDRFAGTIDTHMPTSAVANANLFLRNIHQLGLQAGQSINRVARNALFKAYLGGWSINIDAIAAADTQIHVAALSGFTDVVNPATNVRPSPVSAATPLAVTIGGLANTVINTIPDDANDPTGPGFLVLGAAVGAVFAARAAAVLSSARPDIIRSGGGDTVDALAAGDVFTLQDAINAANRLREHNVPPHEDGFYHAHISPTVNSQVFQDPAFQRLNTALPEHAIYKEAFIGTIAGTMFFMNTESPTDRNSGALTTTGFGATPARYSRDISAETVNNGGIRVGRTIVTGKGTIYERWLNESAYVSEAGVTGKLGEFDVVNAGLEVLTERIRLILRAPMNRLQDQVASTWSISTSFPVPSDVTAGSGAQRFKRAIVIESSLGT
jgi:hypothetical protein